MTTEHTVSNAAQAQVKVVRALLPSDARYDGLRFVVQVECVCGMVLLCPHCDIERSAGIRHSSKCVCQPTGLITRDWSAPKGALEGALRRNLPDGWVLSWSLRNGEEFLDLKVGDWEYYTNNTEDSDLAAGLAVEAALEAQKGTTT